MRRCAILLILLSARTVFAQTASEPQLDIAPLGQLFTSDPQRMDGARASRIQEYRSEDIFLEEPLLPDSNGVYTVPTVVDRRGCLGVKWLESRRIRQLALAFADSSTPPTVDTLQVQCWVGDTAWQGGWQTLQAAFTKQADRWSINLDWTSVPKANNETRKIRLLFPPSSGKTVVSKLWAFTSTPTLEKKFLIQLAKPALDRQVQVECYNGQILNNNNSSQTHKCTWNSVEPLHLSIRYTQPQNWKCDQTVLRFTFPETAFGVAIDDVLSAGCVYVREVGLFVSTDPPTLTLDAYLERKKSRETILDQVRRLPDQTLARAMEKVHRSEQESGPTLLSLACDNHKCVVQRSGIVQFSGEPEADDQYVSKTVPLSCQFEPRMGTETSGPPARHLDEGWLPISVNTLKEGNLAYHQRTFVAPLGAEPSASSSKFIRRPSVCMAEFTVENKGDSPAEARMTLAFWADAKNREVAELRTESSGLAVMIKDRLIAQVDNTASLPLRVVAKEGTADIAGTLAPRSSVRVVVYIPLYRVASSEHPSWPDSGQLLEQTRQYWRQMLADSMQIELPDELLTNAIRASQAHCLLAARNEENGERVAPWIASMSYGPLESEGHSIIRGLDFLGNHEFARRALDFYIHRYSPEGFLTTGYTLMGTGWHLWSLGEHYALAKDSDWLKAAAPEVARVCQWIVRQRHKTMKSDAAGHKPVEFGLMPPGVMADWNAFAYYFCLNGFYAVGLRDAARALADVGYPETETLLREAEQFREEILRAYHWTQARMPVYPLRDGTWVLGYPSQIHCPGPTNNYFAGQDHNRSWCYDVELGAHQLVPLGVLDPMRCDVTGMTEHLEDVQFLEDGWYNYPGEASRKDPYNLGGFSKVQPYYCRNVEIYALRDEVKPFIRSYFNTISSLLNTEDLSIWEHFHVRAGWNKTHETGYFLHQSRTMLLTERGQELWLAPFVTTNWLKDGMTIAVRNAPTTFGPVSYRITSSINEGTIKVTIDPPTRVLPEAVVVRLRHPEGRPIKAVTINGRPHQAFDAQTETIRMAEPKGNITLIAQY